jgi:DNA-directed RNA polymerase I, II, and III subunit RPABC2
MFLKTSKYMTKYEKARVLGIRSIQISSGSPVYIDTNGETDSLRIAQMELRCRQLPLKVRRKFPDGTFEDINVNDLIVI